jgi:hypothetical protein
LDSVGDEHDTGQSQELGLLSMHAWARSGAEAPEWGGSNGTGAGAGVEAGAGAESPGLTFLGATRCLGHDSPGTGPAGPIN